MTFVVKVGTDVETAQPEFAEFAGAEYHGPFATYETAEAFAEAVKAEFAKYPVKRLVYGLPVVEMFEFDEAAGYTPTAAVANWVGGREI